MVAMNVFADQRIPYLGHQFFHVYLPGVRHIAECRYIIEYVT